MPMSTRRETINFFKGMAFLSPWLLGFCLFTALPIGLSFYYSFCDYSTYHPPVFRGFNNYRNLLHDPNFWTAMRNSLEYSALALPMALVLSLSVAILLNTKVVGRSIFRTIIFIPSLIPTVASAMLWMWLYNNKLGLVNYTIGLLHLSGPQWLGEFWVVPALVFMSLWGIGNTVVIYLAGLQDVPRELYEAADLDGAGTWRKLWNVTLPMISPVIFFNLVMAVIGILQVFDAPFIMTGGGPNRASYFFTQFLYDNAFIYLKFGYASALAWIQFLIVLVMTGVTFLTSRNWVHYQGR